MRIPLCVGLFAVCCLPVIAQIDSSTLRAKYGAPLNRETYHLPAGFDLTVDYGSASQVCKLVVPALMPSNETVSNTDVMRRRMYAFLAELVPPSIRGKELNRGSMSAGAISIDFTEYEHVTLAEPHLADPFAGTITVTFKDNGCTPVSQ